uniref:Uncharacterized protein n=1 Tax=Anguilla anguilla TaxID=7936 RepID=A0A0E9SJK0_ANGAN
MLPSLHIYFLAAIGNHFKIKMSAIGRACPAASGKPAA